MFNPMKSLSLVFFLFASVCTSVSAMSLSLSSPDSNILVSVSDDNEHLSYSVQYKGQDVILSSRLGLAFLERVAMGEHFILGKSHRVSVDQTWTQPWGERKFVTDKHNELSVLVSDPQAPQQQYNLRFRAFDDGIGFRYEATGKGDKPLDITDELSEFRFAVPQETDVWWIPSRGWNRYEYLYNTTKLTDVDRANTPFTSRLPSGVHVSIHEAALVDFAAMSLDQRRPGVFKADLAPRSDGLKVKAHDDFVSPWRTIQISSDAKGLLNSNLILNLNEPNKLGDVSWVKPGKYVGIWWGMHLGTQTWGSGDKHGATTANTKVMMDFAAKYGFDGVLVEGWNIGWDGSWYENGDVFSFSQSYGDFDLPTVTAYGKKRGVKLIGHHETSGSISNYDKQMTDAYKLYAKNGVSQVKTGYVADGGMAKRVDEQGITRHEWHDSQPMVNHYLKSVTEAAKYKLSINTHEPIKDTGLRRTYPNWISREGARGQEFNAWGSPPNTPEHTAILPFTRMLAGPMDFTPGIFNLAYEGLDAENRVKTTLAKQLALYVVLYSPIQMAADLIEHYEDNLAAFQFIRDVPTDWQESIAVAAEVGDYVVFTRQQRESKDWYLGALTDEMPRTLEIPLSFLTKGQRYLAQIYRDGDKAHWLTTPYELVIEEREVSQADSLTLKLASSGGTAIRFKAL
jgi:alpha-glucosidase